MTAGHVKQASLIFLAKRFNTAYDLLLDAGNWSGGETSEWLRLLGVVETSAKLSDSRCFPRRIRTHTGTPGSFPFGNKFPLHEIDATQILLAL